MRIQNLVTGVVGEGLGQMASLSYVDLSQNHLTGTIPASISGLPLIELSLSCMYTCFLLPKTGFDCPHVSSKSDNHLNGTIPESIYTVSTLESLLLSGNNLVGTISPEINKLTNLYKLGKQHKSSSPHWFIFLTPTRPLP